MSGGCVSSASRWSSWIGSAAWRRGWPGLAGMTMIDAGDHRLARSFFSTARTAADETGDRHLRAWVAVRESLVPLYYGDPAQAAAAARAAADLAGHQPCVAA